MNHMEICNLYTLIPYPLCTFNTSWPNIYLFQKMKFKNFKFNFSNFQQLKNKCAKNTLCYVFVMITEWEFDFQQFKQI